MEGTARERAQRQGRKPQLPLWLAPIQARILPVTSEYLTYADEIAIGLNSDGVRTDVDDSDQTIERRVREAERAWIPYVIVIGAREKKGGKLPVRVRPLGKQQSMTAQEIVSDVRERTAGMPFRSLTLPLHVTERPGYRTG